MIYLDHNATTPIDPRVFEAMKPYLTEAFGNPSSIYRAGQDVRKAVEDAREHVARLLGAEPREVVFTSGGTESDNTSIKGLALNRGKGHIITSTIEHPAVLKVVEWLEKRGFKATYVPVGSDGVVDPDDIKQAIQPDTIVVSVMHANNEVGTLQPIEQIAAIAHERGVMFHTDAVQTIGKLPIDVKRMGIDLLSLSAHKFYGPKGTGVLYVKRGTKFDPCVHGGHQEWGRRGGTENVAGIVGLGRAVEIAQAEMAAEASRVRVLRDRLEAGLAERIGDMLFNGSRDKRLHNTASVCIKYVEGEAMLLNLDMRHGIAASSGSACTSGSLEPSHVLLAMGIPAEIAHGSLRFSLGRATTREEIDKVIEVLPPIVEKLRSMSAFPRKNS
ncbi:MAG: cysteine desulfurase NifS [Candidatus Eisenbacteria bacterium]